MKWIPLFLLLFSGAAQAAGVSESPKPKPKSQFNTQVYEQESEEVSFEAVVKVVREVQGDTQVFFEGKQGFFVLASASSQPLLVKSQKSKAPVHVVVDMRSRQILKVEPPGSPAN